jgi:hypothetical protein
MEGFMAFDFKTVVPWGRSMEEYVAMFSLSHDDLGGKILDCGAGPSSFNAEVTQRGGKVVSCDPLYANTAAAISTRIEETCSQMIDSMEREKERFIWTAMGSPHVVGETRMRAMNLFLEDFDIGKRQGRYVTGELPKLPLEGQRFDIALSSHLLFLYTSQLSLVMHLQSIREMVRVARQVRIFPLLDLQGEPSDYLSPVLADLSQEGLKHQVREVKYEFQRGGNQMLVVNGKDIVDFP